MIKLNKMEMEEISGGTNHNDHHPSNRQIAKDLAKATASGAVSGIRGGLPGMTVGAGLGATKYIVSSAIKNGPVHVSIPTVPMKPSWANKN
ncbi:hypothetical protein L7G72_11725 [Xenorhabdus bovienii]|uniref:E492 group microcin n=1 Tax=Xenorhabdus bovienii TaxID=40576 RepID=UPI001EDFC6D2|nr:hypothetical protein [Xenorhabdus bovienii]MCG3462512.1 hypothetical protein [Xenorhabdus bovienii]